MDNQFRIYVSSFFLLVLFSMSTIIFFFLCSLPPSLNALNDDFHPRDFHSTSIAPESRAHDIVEIQPVILTKTNEKTKEILPTSIIVNARAKQVFYKAPKIAHILETNQ